MTAPVRFVHPLLRARDYQERVELSQLVDWWRSGGVGVCALVGIGGTGKTAIVERFLRLLPGVLPPDSALPKDFSLRRPDGLFVFSFYDAPNPDAFFASLSAWLLGEAPGRKPALSYAKTLGILEKGRPTLLVLDGLEKVQDDGVRDGVLGQIQDGRLRDLIRRGAEGYLQGSALVITTRFRLLEPLVQRSTHYHPIAVDKLTREASVTLLRTRGVRKGTEDTLARLADEHGRHALTVDLLGGFIGWFCDGDPRKLPAQREMIVVESAELDPEVLALREQERKLARVSDAYRSVFQEKDPAALALLGRVCLFRLGVTAEVLAAIFTGDDKEQVSGPELAALRPRELQGKLSWLAALRLLEATRPVNGETLYTVHPAVRDGFLRGLDSNTARLGHQAVREELRARLGGRPGEGFPSTPAALDLLEEIVYHTLKAALVQEAWDLYWDRIGNYKNLGWRLGAYERGERICRAFVANRPPETVPLPVYLSENDQIVFVNEWALYLGDLGRLDAAARCGRCSIEARKRQREWTDAAMSTQNLAEVTLAAGRLRAGKRAAKEALSLAERGNDAFWQSSSYAYLGYARALLGESENALEDFEKALFWHRKTASEALWPLYSLRGIQLAFLLSRLGRLDEAERLTKKNLEIWAEKHQRDGCYCRLLLADLAHRRGDLTAASQLEAQAHEWALARDAKEPLCWAALVRARILLSAGQPGEALSHLDEGLRCARDHGLGIYYLDLLNTLAAAHLLAGRPEEAEQAARAALYGVGNRDDSTPTDQRGLFPPEDTGLPVLLAATHPECLYAWGEGDARHLLAEALLLRAAASSDLTELVCQARRELEAARDLRHKIKDPRAEEISRRLAEIEQGVLTHYRLPEAASALEKHASTPIPARIRNQVFISYSHKDKIWLDRLQTLLKPLVRSDTISLWDDTSIQPGARWKEEIWQALASSRLALLLVSDHFLASDFIVQEELSPLLAAAGREGVQILWVYLRPCLWKASPIAGYQATHSTDQALIELPEPAQQRVLLSVAEEIQRAAAERCFPTGEADRLGRGPAPSGSTAVCQVGDRRGVLE